MLASHDGLQLVSCPVPGASLTPPSEQKPKGQEPEIGRTQTAQGLRALHLGNFRIKSGSVLFSWGRLALSAKLSDKKYLSTKEAADFLELSEDHIFRLRHRPGEGPRWYRHGGKVRYALSDLHIWLVSTSHV